jgi:hypothetical protein
MIAAKNSVCQSALDAPKLAFCGELACPASLGAIGSFGLLFTPSRGFPRQPISEQIRFLNSAARITL